MTENSALFAREAGVRRRTPVDALSVRLLRLYICLGRDGARGPGVRE